MSIESAKVAVCPECGSSAETRAPSLFSDGWIRLSIIAGAVLFLGLGIRMLSSRHQTAATPPPPPLATAQQFLGEMSLFDSGGTFDSLRAGAEGRKDLEVSSAQALRALGADSSVVDPERAKRIRVRMGVVRSPYLYQRTQWRIGWPTALVDLAASSTRWLAESPKKPKFSTFGNLDKTYWLGLVRHWVEPERGFTLQLTWAAAWVAWSFATIGFLFSAVLLHRWRRWKFGAALVCIAIFVCVLAWPSRTETLQAPVGLSLDQTIDFGLSLAEFDALAATQSGRRELASRVLRVGQEQFAYERMNSLGHAKPFPQFEGVVTKGKNKLEDFPPDAVPVFALYSSELREGSGATLLGRTEWKSFGLVTVSRSEYQLEPGSNPVGFSVSDDGFESKQIVIPTAIGYNRYSVWMSRLAIDIGTVLAVPAAVFLLRVAWLCYRSRVRSRTGACQVCGYDLLPGTLASEA